MSSTVAPGHASASKREILARIPFFTEAPSDLRKALLEQASVVRIEAGEFFLREGDTCGHFALVISGRIRVFKLGENGHEITLYHVGPGEACPLNVSSILSDRAVPAMAKVEEDLLAIAIPALAFRAWVAEHESLRTFVFQMFSTRLMEVMSLVEEVAFRRMNQRLARRLEELLVAVGPPGGLRVKPGGSVEVTHAGIADDLGTAREVVSRLLKEFERRGAIRLSRGRILLRDGALLRVLAAGS